MKKILFVLGLLAVIGVLCALSETFFYAFFGMMLLVIVLEVVAVAVTIICLPFAGIYGEIEYYLKNWAEARRATR